jgi:hypothetical protein
MSNRDQAIRLKAGRSGGVFGFATFDLRSGEWAQPFSVIELGIEWLDGDILLSIEKSTHERLDYELTKNRVVDAEFLGRIAEEQLTKLLGKHFGIRPAVRCKILFGEP